MAFTYRYPRAALTVDCVIFGFNGGSLKVLLIRRGIDPFKGCWALPGGFVKPEETLEEAARRELEEETGLKDLYLEQLHTFGAIDRDPRERVISVAYFALVRDADHLPIGDTDAAEAAWHDTHDIPALAFDHPEILDAARNRLKAMIRRAPIGFELLPKKFTISQLQALYEAILGHSLDKRNFRKKLLSLDFLTPLEESSTQASKRPAQLFCFDHAKYQNLTQTGFSFDL